MPTVITHGFARFDGPGQPEIMAPNLTHLFSDQVAFEGFVRSGRWAPFATLGVRVQFRRHSAQRPLVAGQRPRGRDLHGRGNDNWRNNWERAIEYNGTMTTANGTLTSRSDAYSQLLRTFGRTFTLAAPSSAIGSYVIATDFASSNLPSTPSFVNPVSTWGSQALSEVDLPQTTIGNIHKHPVNRSAWFNEVTIVPLSQGQITLTGAYSPPEERLHHAGYQIYYAKTGGTGVIEGAVKTTGATAAGTPARFTDTTFAGFVVGDVGKYIAIHGVGIYLITAFVDASNVDTDAVTINEGFGTASGLTWSLRTGPIGEYFWRKRPYFFLDSWTNYASPTSTELWFVNLDEILLGFGNVRTEWNAIPQRVVYDGYSQWWWTIPGMNDRAFGLMRQLHMSPQGMQAPIFDGTLTGLVGPALFGGTVTLSNWAFEDIMSDKNRKLWISAKAAAVTNYSLARVHPAPGGNAAAPAVEAMWRKQQNAADAAGLTASDIIALCDDQSGAYSGGAGTHRIWAIGGNGEVAGAAGGLSYSDDDGTTWKRVHPLSAATGTVTATNGSNAVLGVGTLFTTEFAVGDWIRFGADTRSYEIATITDDLNIVLATNYAGVTAGGKAVQKGALAANEAICKTSYSYSNTGAGDNAGQHNIDWDTNGNVFWLSHSNRICKWDPGAGTVTSFADTAIPAMGGLGAINAGMVRNLKVSRIPTVAGAGAHPFHNDIWLGTNYSNGGALGTNGGWVRVIGSTFNAAPTSADFTRYHYNCTANNFPISVLVPSDGSGTNNGYTSVLVEPSTGNIVLASSFTKDSEGRLGWHWLLMTGPASGAAAYWQATQNHVYAGNNGMGLAAAIREPYMRAAFDQYGMGFACIVSAQDSGYVTVDDAQPPMSLNATCWLDRRWNGSAWVRGLLAGTTFFDLNLRGGTNGNTQNAILGAGFRRMHEWSVPLDDGMHIAFQQAGGAVAQSDEFLADETSTFVCTIGGIKDNTQTCNVYYDFFVNPVAYRNNDETPKTVRNIWTQDGGVEGLYTTAVDGGLTGLKGTFGRGRVDYFKYPIGGGVAAGYLNSNNQTVNAAIAVHPTAVLRIADEGEFAGDGSWTGGTDLFNSAGGHAFVVGDVGKSIFIEGANGATPDADNGQAVILAVNSGTQVQVDKTFATTRAGIRWKLRDVPAVAFVEMGLYASQVSHNRLFHRHDLWSSNDYGQNWVLTKYSGEGSNSIPVGGPDDVSPGAWYTTHNGYPSFVNLVSDGNQSGSPSVIFDLRDLPEATRRRQYWKWRMYDPDGQQTANVYYAGMYLYDEQFRLLNRPANNKVEDADDPLYQSTYIVKPQLLRKTGTGATPIDDGNADGLTNLIDVDDPLYLTTGTNDAQVTAAGRFIAPSALFTRISIGKYIRISDASDATNNGWALITGFVSDVEVQTSKAFVNETNTFDWQLLDVGPGDEIRIDSATRSVPRGVELNDIYYTIVDVPLTDRVLVQQVDVPHPVTPANWDIGRPMPNHTSVHASSLTNFDTASYLSWGHIEGTLHFSYDLEFVTVQTSTVTATTPADDDGDGRTDLVTMGEALLAAGGATDGPVVGDYIEVAHASYGTRVFEIVSITGADPNKVIKLKYDEMLPALASGLTWRILRPRGLQYILRRLLITGKGQAPA